jgi:hypothetical protein
VRPPEGDRLINLRVIVTFADAGKHGALKRYANGLYDLLRCSADVCDANNYKVQHQADGTVLLRMTGGMYIGLAFQKENCIAFPALNCSMSRGQKATASFMPN